MIVALVCSYEFFGTASYERAKTLGRFLDLNKDGEMLIEVAYDRMDPAEFEQRLGNDKATSQSADKPQPTKPSLFDDAFEDDGDENNPYRNL